MEGLLHNYWNKTGSRQYEFDFLKSPAVSLSQKPETRIFQDMLSVYYEYWTTTTGTKMNVLDLAKRVRQVDEKGDDSPILKFVAPKIGKKRTEKGLELAMTRAVELAWKSL